MAPKRMAMSLAELLKSPEAPSADHLEKWFTKDPKKLLQQNHINMKPNNQAQMEEQLMSVLRCRVTGWHSTTKKV